MYLVAFNFYFSAFGSFFTVISLLSFSLFPHFEKNELPSSPAGSIAASTDRPSWLRTL